MKLTCKGVFAVLSKFKARIRVLETYFFCKGNLELAVYTDSLSRCHRMNYKEPRSSAEVLTDLQRNATFFSSSKKVCYSYIRKAKSVLTVDDIEGLLNRNRALTFTCLQTYLEPRNLTDPILTLTITLENGLYVQAYSLMQGVKHLVQLQLQQKMMEVAKLVMHKVQEAERLLIEVLELEFIQDSDKVLWLVNVPVCKLVVKVTTQQVGISHSMVSYERVAEQSPPAFEMFRPSGSSKAQLHDITLPTHHQASQSSLPIVSKIYQQIKETPNRVKPKAKCKSTPDSPISKKKSSMGGLASFLAKTITLPSNDEPNHKTTVSSAFKDLLSKYIGKSSVGFMTCSADEEDLSPMKSSYNLQSEAAEQAKPEMQLRLEATDQRASVVSRRSKSGLQIIQNPELKKFSPIHTMNFKSRRSSTVIDLLNSRQQELLKKYGPSSHKAVVVSAKPTSVSPYASLGIKIKE